jgi:hypothetical protein
MRKPVLDPLATFIDHARGKDMDHATIRMLLLSAGWKERDVAPVLSAQALEHPVPTPPDVGGAREDVRAGARQRRPRITDPESGAPYTYQVTGESTFKVCATFAQARDRASDPAWNHPAGRHCFDFDALTPGR